MPKLIPKKLHEESKEDKIFHYGNHKLYSYDNRPGYKKNRNDVF